MTNLCCLVGSLTSGNPEEKSGVGSFRRFADLAIFRQPCNNASTELHWPLPLPQRTPTAWREGFSSLGQILPPEQFAQACTQVGSGEDTPVLPLNCNETNKDVSTRMAQFKAPLVTHVSGRGPLDSHRAPKPSSPWSIRRCLATVCLSRRVHGGLRFYPEVAASILGRTNTPGTKRKAAQSSHELCSLIFILRVAIFFILWLLVFVFMRHDYG